jgi:hypothetical protein
MSHTEGYLTKTTEGALASHAGGAGTIASAYAQTAIGRYNEENSNALFIVGNGYVDETDPSNLKTVRQNAFVVDKNGNVFANNKQLATKDELAEAIGLALEGDY